MSTSDRALSGYRTVAVTGANGFIGGHLLLALHEFGLETIGVDLADRPSDCPADHWRQVDLRSRTSTHRALEGAGLVFHLAGNASGTRSVREPLFDFETNALATQHVVDACRSADVERFVLLSSAMVYGRPITVPITEEHPASPLIPYAASKLAAESIVRAAAASYRFPAVIARAFVVYGPGENPDTAEAEVSLFVRSALAGLPIKIIGDPDSKTRDFIHVSDLVHALITIADRAPAGSVTNIGTGREISLRQLAELVGSATGRAIEVHQLDATVDDEFRMVADTSRLTKLGFTPEVALHAGVSELAKALATEFDERVTA